MKQLFTKLLLVSGCITMGSAAAAPTSLDLTGATTSGSIGLGTYSRVMVQPAGSGVMASFSRIQQTQPATREQGYNTDADGVYDNDTGGHTFNHSITAGQIGLFDPDSSVAGDEVMRFLLDINQSNSAGSSKINLDNIQIYLARQGDLSSQPGLGTLGDRVFSPADAYLVYQMDTTADDNKVILDGNLAPGSGIADMYLDLSAATMNAAFAAAGFNTAADRNGAFVYLYSRFGSDPNQANSGFEEWGAITGAAFVEPPCDSSQRDCGGQQLPEPGSLSMMSLGLLGAAVMYSRRRRS